MNDVNNELNKLQKEIELLKSIISNKDDKILEYQSIIDQIPANVFWKDKDGVYLGCSKTVALSLGYPDSESLVGESDYSPRNQWASDTKIFENNDHNIILSGESSFIEETFFGEDGSKKVYLNSKAPLKNKFGEACGIVGVAFDVTDRKILEEETKLQKAELEKQAEIKKEFVKSFNHDVRLPINAATGRLIFLKNIARKFNIEDENLNNKIAEAINNLDTNITSIENFLKEMEDVLLNEKFEKRVYKTDFNVIQVIENEFNFAKASRPSLDQVIMNKIVHSDIPKFITSDAIKVSQILRNLLSNAVKYTEKGNINLEVEMIKNNDNYVLKFIIIDTGIGIDDSDRDKIYQLGRRLVTSYNTNIHGFGLGLYLVKSHIDVMQGKIDFESTVGYGSKFWVEIPFEKAQDKWSEAS